MNTKTSLIALLFFLLTASVYAMDDTEYAPMMQRHIEIEEAHYRHLLRSKICEEEHDREIQASNENVYFDYLMKDFNRTKPTRIETNNLWIVLVLRDENGSPVGKLTVKAQKAKSSLPQITSAIVNGILTHTIDYGFDPVTQGHRVDTIAPIISKSERKES
jgi:hypothetical protein